MCFLVYYLRFLICVDVSCEKHSISYGAVAGSSLLFVTSMMIKSGLH